VPNIDSRPTVIDIDHYGGDTLSLHVTIDPLVVAGRTLTAQVRSRPASPKLDATFDVYPSETGAVVVLSGESCLELARRGKYRGYWDMQLAEADGDDPVTTLAHGKMILHPDVTRVES
jgi:hypothetical protein